MSNEEKIFSALGAFKDWSNYLLVTTVAALGWVSTDSAGICSGYIGAGIIWCFALSIMFGIFTLALIPVIAESIDNDTESFYTLDANFKMFWMWGDEKTFFPIKAVCWPQHVLFVLGILLYAYAISSHGL